MHSLFNIPVFQAAFSWVLIVKATVFYKGKLNSKCAYIAQNARWITSVLSDDIDAILPCTAIYNQPKFSLALYVQYTIVSSCFLTLYCTVSKYILHGKVHIVFLQFALTLHWMRDKTKVFYPTIYQRSCHVPHSTFSQKNKINNIQEFQAAFSTLYCTVGKCILHRKSAYSVRLHYKECSLKIRCFIREYLSDPYF